MFWIVWINVVMSNVALKFLNKGYLVFCLFFEQIWHRIGCTNLYCYIKLFEKRYSFNIHDNDVYFTYPCQWLMFCFVSKIINFYSYVHQEFSKESRRNGAISDAIRNPCHPVTDTWPVRYLPCIILSNVMFKKLLKKCRR